MKTLGFFYAMATALLWGLVYAIDEKILTRTSPLTLLFVTSFFSALLLLPFILSHPEEIRSLLRSGTSNLALIVLTIVLVTLSNFLIYSSIQKIGAVSASMIEIAYPLFVAVFGLLLFARSINLPVMIGGLLVFLGSIVIIRFG